MVLRPLKAGYFNFTSATVSYLVQEGGQVVVKAVKVLSESKHLQSIVMCWKLKCPLLPFLQVGYSSAPGQGGILAQREFDRRFSPHYVSVKNRLRLAHYGT